MVTDIQKEENSLECNSKEKRIGLRTVIVVMIVVTLFAPFGVYFYYMHGEIHNSVEIWSLEISVHAILWGIMPPGTVPSGEWEGGFYFLEPFVVYRGILLGIFNIAYAYGVIKYCMGEGTKRGPYAAAILSLIPPLLFTIPFLPRLISLGILGYTGPIPIQLVVGWLLMRYSGPTEPTRPWKEVVSEEEVFSGENIK